MDDVSLSKSVRQNLLIFQKASSQIDETSINLTTGKKINEATDNPSAFFTAQSLKHRAQDLSNLLDSMGQVLQTVKAADEGITSISNLVETALAAANSALQTNDVTERAAYAQQYNTLLEQIEFIAKDSGYNGKNLLGGFGNDLTVYFNEDNTNTLTIAAVDYTDTTDPNYLNLKDLTATYTKGTASIALGAAVSGDTVLNGNVAGFSAGDTLTVTNSASETSTLSITATTTVDDLVAFFKQIQNLDASFEDASNTISLTSLDDFTISSDGAGGGSYAGNTLDFIPHSWVDDSDIQDSINLLNEARKILRAQAATFGGSITIVENRQKFTTNMIGALAVGEDKITATDVNEEGAKMLALRIQQDLIIETMSISSEQRSNVLKLFP